MKNSKAIIFTLALAAAAGGLWWYSNSQSAPQSGGWGGGQALVSLETVSYQTVRDQVEAVGTLLANESVDITSKVSDIVTRIHFEDGDLVEEGDILVELLNQEQSAQLAEARANLTDAQLQLDRLERLGSNVASASLIDEARARYDASQARLNAIVARMEDRLIRAPFAGMLGFREISPGSLVNASTLITTLDDIETLDLEFNVPETAFGSLQRGDAIVAHSAAYPGQTFNGAVTSVSPRIDPVTRSVAVRAAIPNPNLQLRPGMLMTLSLITAEREALVISEQAVLQKNGRSLVYVANDEMKVFERDIVIDQRRRGLVEVGAGLEPGERIVVDGIMGVLNGSSIKEISDQEDTSDQGWGG